MVVMFNDLDTIMYFQLLSDTLIIISLKYQKISGIGSPTDLHKNVAFSCWFIIASLIKFSILGITAKQKAVNMYTPMYVCRYIHTGS